MLTPSLLRWLASEEAHPWLEALTASPPDDAHLLPALTELRRRFAADQARALVSQARLRQRAEAKFPGRASRMFFTDRSLQQATPQPVATWTAQRYAAWPWVADLGCGLGGDALALAAGGPRVLAVDRDPVALTLVQLNARALGLSSRIHPIRAEIPTPAWRLPAAWADPGRRQDGRRIFHPDALQPPLRVLLELQRRHTPHLGIKLMPGLDHRHIPAHAEAEWISLHGQLKELVLWFGDLAERTGRRATVLPAGASLWHEGAQARTAPPGRYLVEPDPAVIRAGAVGDLAVQLGLWHIDPAIAYLSGDAPVETPFARSWPILEHHPFHLKNLNRRLRQLGARVIAVKKRGFAVEPEAFRRRLHQTPDGPPVIVVLTRVQNRPWMLLLQGEH
jgi:SAM-dependent methyltransferase